MEVFHFVWQTKIYSQELFKMMTSMELPGILRMQMENNIYFLNEWWRQSSSINETDWENNNKQNIAWTLSMNHLMGEKKTRQMLKL